MGAVADLIWRRLPTIQHLNAHVALLYGQEKAVIRGIGSYIDKFGILFVGYYVSTVIFYSVSHLV